MRTASSRPWTALWRRHALSRMTRDHGPQLEEPEQGAGPDQSASSFVPKTLLPFMKRLPVKRVVHVANVTEDPVRVVQGIAQHFFIHMRCGRPDAAPLLDLLPANLLPHCPLCPQSSK